MSLTLSNYKFLEKLKLSGNYNDDYDYDILNWRLNATIQI